MAESERVYDAELRLQATALRRRFLCRQLYTNGNTLLQAAPAVAAQRTAPPLPAPRVPRAARRPRRE